MKEGLFGAVERQGCESEGGTSTAHSTNLTAAETADRAAASVFFVVAGADHTAAGTADLVAAFVFLLVAGADHTTRSIASPDHRRHSWRQTTCRRDVGAGRVRSLLGPGSGRGSWAFFAKQVSHVAGAREALGSDVGRLHA